jgi:hypothetical protein
MFALNAAAFISACAEPRALKEPSPHEPRASTVSSVHHCARSDQRAECVRSDVLALDGREAAQQRRFGRHVVLSLVHM